MGRTHTIDCEICGREIPTVAENPQDLVYLQVRLRAHPEAQLPGWDRLEASFPEFFRLLQRQPAMQADVCLHCWTELTGEAKPEPEPLQVPAAPAHNGFAPLPQPPAIVERVRAARTGSMRRA